MKRYINITALAILLASFQFAKLRAQPRLSISRVYLSFDTVFLNTPDSIWFSVKNTGNTTIAGYVAAEMGVDSILTTPTLIDSAYTTLNPNDSVKFGRKLTISQPNFHLGINIVVVWPRSSGVTQVDSAQTTLVVLSPNGINDRLFEKEGIRIYPNPSSSKIYIWAKQLDLNVEQVRIYNSIGQLVSQLRSKRNVFDISELESGLYFIEIETARGEKQMKKFIKE